MAAASAPCGSKKNRKEPRSCCAINIFPNPSPAGRDLYLVDWSPGRGSEQTGRRPALVVQENAASANPNYPLTIVAAVTTQVSQRSPTSSANNFKPLAKSVWISGLVQCLQQVCTALLKVLNLT
ncbi:MAG: type II toxin-antitoxin system PemK/MazF family toxin [Candidatus Eremiobacteraeota bacterium]|nr:type II toxin-antitoxin system PemK/MazF family toxin [Candidatus Eremiobacteraeota bacterium]MCW5866992.1 type II toxin-antitoxin system PemK/MazF family toxin [Candidatus Eremiobacteraeota bacterium]